MKPSSVYLTDRDYVYREVFNQTDIPGHLVMVANPDHLFPDTVSEGVRQEEEGEL